MRSVVIAAPMSGSGKTTVTLGIMAALKRRGLVVAPFKVGPDFIDPGWHRLVTGRPSINLDGWICPGEFVRETFSRNSSGAHIAVIEGVMGLFDGIDGASEAGSTAQAAKLTGSPVVLVVDARSQARSAAALVKGFAGFDPGLSLAGVIFNNVGSANHGRILEEAVAASCTGVRVLGCIPRDEALGIPSRHLGLVTAGEDALDRELLERLASTMERHLDLEAILDTDKRGQALTWDNDAVQCQGLTPETKGLAPVTPKTRIAVARDGAFSFIYEDNLRLLREAGAELVDFSPMADSDLPGDIGGIYLPGGYPELFAGTLAANLAMKGAIRRAVEAGMPVYAECGGFIYLSGGLRGHPPLVGIYPVTAEMLPRRKALGYRQVEFTRRTILGPGGTVARGHEFHYSEMEEMPPRVERAYRVTRLGRELGAEGFLYKNCLASYIHLHFGSAPGMAAAFVDSCVRFKQQ